MSLAEEIEKLRRLHESGALTAEEFAQAKASVLGAAGSPLSMAPGPLRAVEQDRTRDHLEQIELQNEVARLDREWEMERESFEVAGHHGSRGIPSEGGSVAGSILIVVFGGFLTVFAASSGAPGFFVLLLIFFVLAGVASGTRSFSKATGYREARERYQQRRSQLLSCGRRL